MKTTFRWFTAVLWAALMAACNPADMPHRDLMPGISESRDAYEEAVNEAGGTIDWADATVQTDPADELAQADEPYEERRREREHREDAYENSENRYENSEESMDEMEEDNPQSSILNPQSTSILQPARLSDRSEKILQRAGYVTSYNQDLRIPNWTLWVLTGEHTSGPYKRKGVQYHEDDEVDFPKAMNSDYSGSGYDRGHMCPAGDNKWDRQAMEDCFLFTNMVPQSHNNNGGDWNDLEMKCRTWAKRYGEIVIVCGPILSEGRHKTIGRNKVTVPERLFKVVARLGSKPCGIAFVYDNEDGHRPMEDYVCTIDEVERLTGIDFFANLDKRTQEKIESEADFDDWR